MLVLFTWTASLNWCMLQQTCWIAFDWHVINRPNHFLTCCRDVQYTRPFKETSRILLTHRCISVLIRLSILHKVSFLPEMQEELRAIAAETEAARAKRKRDDILKVSSGCFSSLCQKTSGRRPVFCWLCLQSSVSSHFAVNFDVCIQDQLRDVFLI